MCAQTDKKDNSQQKFYVEGYIKEIKVEKDLSNKEMTAMFTFSSDWQGKDSKFLYGVLDPSEKTDKIKSYDIYEPTDWFYSNYYSDCLVPKMPLHLGIYFKEEKGNDYKFSVTAFRVIYEC